MDLEGLNLPMVDNQPQPPTKRVCLRHYDLVPAQMLNPMGASGISAAPLKTLSETMQMGNQATSYFSEYCSEDMERQAIALSRFCVVMLSAIRRLLDTLSHNVIQETVYVEACKEAQELMPYLMALRSSGAAPLSTRGFAYASSSADAADPTAVRTAAEYVYDWLKKEKSMLRSIVMFFRGYEQSSRALSECYGLTKEHFVAMAAVSATRPNDPSL